MVCLNTTKINRVRVRVSKTTCVIFDVRAGYRVSDGVSGLVEGLVGASHGGRNPGPEG